MKENRLIRALVVLAIITCIAGGVWTYSNHSKEKAIVQQLEAADEAIANGNYEEACSIYESCYDNEKYAAQVEENFAALAEKAKAEANPTPVFRYYQLYKDESELESLYTDLGEQYLEEHHWEAAKQCFLNAGEDERVYDITLLQADDLINKGQGNQVPELLCEYTGQEVANYVFRAANVDGESLSKRQKSALANEYGSKISDIDTQLMYCKLLDNNGYDLNAVYPDGVEVDYDLSEYAFFDIQENPSENYDNYDLNKVLVFSWEDTKPDLKPETIDEDGNADPFIPIETLSVKLHPELMWENAQNFLSSADQYPSAVILKKGYIEEGRIEFTSKETSSSVTLSSSQDNYYYYACYEVIYLCDLKTKQLHVMYEGYLNDPIMINCQEEVDTFYPDFLDSYSSLPGSIYSDLISEHTDLYVWYEDEEGNSKKMDIDTSNVDQWNTEQFMVGTFEDDWMNQQLQNSALPVLISYPILSAYYE